MEASKEEGLRVGLIPEKKFEDLCIEHGVVFVSTKKFHGWKPVLDLVHGDYLILIIRNILRIDVKGGSISKESILNFKGDYFVIFENSNESALEGLVFNPTLLRELIKGWKDKDFDVMPLSGEPGILYSRLIKLKEHASTIHNFLRSLDT